METAILAVALFAFIGLFAAFGLVRLHESAADNAARSAARAASEASDPDTAQARAHSAATDALTSDGLSCSRLSIAVDTSGFAAPPGQPATVSTTVTCTVPLSQLAIPGLPGSKTITGHFVSAIDEYTNRK